MVSKLNKLIQAKSIIVEKYNKVDKIVDIFVSRGGHVKFEKIRFWSQSERPVAKTIDMIDMIYMV